MAVILVVPWALKAADDDSGTVFKLLSEARTQVARSDRFVGLAGFIRCESELEVSKLRVTDGQTRDLNDIQVQFRNAVCIGFYGDDIACFRPIKLPQDASNPNAVSNVEAMIHTPNLRDTSLAVPGSSPSSHGASVRASVNKLLIYGSTLAASVVCAMRSLATAYRKWPRY
jgi:hypothetical protein